jgi:hypothetical protein
VPNARPNAGPNASPDRRDDARDDARDDGLPPWAADLLRAPLADDDGGAARARVMARVRRLPRHHHRAGYRVAAAAPRWARRRGVLAPAGALLAAALTAVAAGARLGPGGAAGDPLRAALGTAFAGALDTALGTPLAATVLGDTVLRGTGLGASILGDAVRDTLRVVRFAFAAPAAARVALAGEFTGWRAAAPLARDARSGAWTVTLVVPRDVVRYAFVVDGPHGRHAVPAPPLPAAAREPTSGSTNGPTTGSARGLAHAATAGDST